MPGTESQRRWPEVGFAEIAIDLLPSPFLDREANAERFQDNFRIADKD